ncbi:DUF998 domain-containing protein [Amycolatopsis cynarae]|uniref:DUF998 domain-containing protein n=1 Tax=Amycolatopsis cynarae TaxID=2995223 RepID=A0ABY7B339_9PSEU|nr:DUF998 domain-containing protein [Amycolatopsis sp. HUAS 11-8]WAL65311.1 DUF998 domain-containing protein [Amycolatopsis sp. HUAS 11-8]
MGITSEQGDRTRLWLIAAAVAIAWSGFTMTVLHLISGHNPVTDTLSSYAFTDRGTGMLAASMLALAAGSLALLAALSTTSVPVRGTPRILFGTWSAGLTLAAFFPASYDSHPDPVSGEIHLYSCLVAFLSLPALALCLLERFARFHEVPGRRLLARLSYAAVACLLVFGLCILCPWLLPVGVVQRATLAVDVALLCSIIAVLWKAISAPVVSEG